MNPKKWNSISEKTAFQKNDNGFYAKLYYIWIIYPQIRTLCDLVSSKIFFNIPIREYKCLLFRIY